MRLISKTPVPDKETPIVSIDCEMVEVNRCSDALARVSIVNYNGEVLMDQHCSPEGRITNFRTWVSGVMPKHVKDAPKFALVREKVIKLLKDKKIVGHSLQNDFRVLDMEVPKKLIRDLKEFKKYHNEQGRVIGLKNLTELFLGVQIQSG